MSSQESSISNGSMTGATNNKNWSLIALIVGVVGLLIAIVGMVTGYLGGDSRAWYSWLIGIAFWMSILIGSLL